MIKPYTDWKRGDKLRVLQAVGDFYVGEVVLHDDIDGDSAPYCSKLNGTVTKFAIASSRLEFVKRGVTAQEELVDALKPFLEALRVNESDTMSSLRKDDVALFATAGSWTGFRTVTLGDLRKLGKAASMLGI